jgi:FtsP/CotA-like multicopper oxidase with cupredoxin domain
MSRRPRTFGLAAALLLAQLSCSSDAANTETAANLELTKLTDTSPDPDVFEAELVASKGITRYLPDGDADIWGYRDGAVKGSHASVPGPLLEVKRGQTVIVHLRNELTEATTIHWHGLRVPNASDGTPSVQVEVPPGGTYDYRFVANDAGTFWYHPHVHSDVQIERGLYGVVIVRGGPNIPVEADRTFVLDDVKLEATGKLSRDTVPLDVMLGRQGNVVLANGVNDGRIVVKSGARERWRFVNSANGRYFNLRLKKHRFKVIGWDGGVIAEPYDVDTLLIVPGERYEVLVELPDAPGTSLTLETLHYDRGHKIPDPGPIPVFELDVDGAAAKAKALPASWGAPVDLEASTDAPQRNIKLSEKEKGEDGLPKFFINEQAFPDVPPIEASSGDIEVWRIENTTEMDHPFHLHGMFFRVLDLNGAAPEHDGWKDTVNVPQKQTATLAVRYGETGTWMYHCHILEHAERGMMGELKLAR